jgi:ectoine hydroxylase
MQRADPTCQTTAGVSSTASESARHSIATASGPVADAAPDRVRDENVQRLRGDGYTVIPNALSGAQLAAIRERWDCLMDDRLAACAAAGGSTQHVEIKRIVEQDPVFEALMDLPTVFPVVREVLGPDVTLASGGEGDYRAPRTQAYISWHNDFVWMQNVPYPRQNFWVRCVYLIDDVTPDMGPFTLLPGSHLAGGPPPSDWTVNGQPTLPPEAVGITGAAGACLINNTEIWHTNTPNLSDRPRKLIMIVYKHAWMQQWQDGYEVSAEFAARQVLPMRRQLCGLVTWHNRETFAT